MVLGIADSIIGVAGKVLDKFVEDKDLKTKLNAENVISSSAQLPSGIISSSGQIKTEITGAFYESSHSLQSRVSINESEIATLQAGGSDNLGNHIATQDLDMGGNTAVPPLTGPFSIKNLLNG